MLRLVAVVACAAWLAACSPTFDWRAVDFGRNGASGVLPDAPRTETRPITFESWVLPLTMRSARAGSVLFALGAAPLPPELAADAPARERLAHWATASFYRNAGIEPPASLPMPGQRFLIEGQGPQGPLRMEVRIEVTADEWLEAIVVAAPEDYARAPVEDFWLSLRWRTPGVGTSAPGTGAPARLAAGQ